MDRKSVIILVFCFVLLVLWYPLMNRLYPPRPVDPAFGPGATNVASPSTNTPAARAPAPPTRQPAAPAAAPPVDERLVTIENENVRYVFSTLGGAIRSVALKGYPESIACNRPEGVSTNVPRATLNREATVPAMSLLGPAALEPYELTAGSNFVQAVLVTTNGLRIEKQFVLSTNYLVKASVRFVNQSGGPLRVPAQEWIVGTATPLGSKDTAALMGAYWFDGEKGTQVNDSWFANRTLGCIPGPRRSDYVVRPSKLGWVAVYNQFFTMITMPAELPGSLVVRETPLRDTNATQTVRTGYETALIYPELLLQPDQTIERHWDIFAGPKEYGTLSRLGNKQYLVMDFGGFFGWFAQVLLFSMNRLHAAGLPYAAAIIVITVIIKLLFWPLTNASTKSMKRMAALQPQMKALQEKYKDDPKKMNMKLMEFMREHKVSPLGGCLPMLLQIPVFFGFYKMLQTAIELRGERFLWACDLSQADTVANVFGFPVNPLPLLMGATMLWQARLTPVSPGMDPVQQKIMKYMPLMFMVFLYNFSAGLTLYWTVQNLLTIAQMKLTRAQQDPATTPRPGLPPRAPGAPRRKK